MLERERAYFAAHQKNWMENHSEHFVVIHDDLVLGFFNDEMSAIEAGAKALGNKPFLFAMC